MNSPVAVVLAAGKGTRMKSELPKVLFPVCGRPMIHFVLDALEQVGVSRTIVVVGYRADQVREALSDRDGVEFADQTEQLGTGHAVQMAAPALRDHVGPVFVLAGDSPLVQPTSLRQLLERFSRGDLAALLGTLEKADPSGLGRIVRDEAGKFQRIVEHKDASEAERAIREVNMSTYLFDGPALLEGLGQLSNDNAQGEYYVTDLPAIMLSKGHAVEAAAVLQPCEALSINTLDQLQLVEAKMRELGYRQP